MDLNSISQLQIWTQALPERRGHWQLAEALAGVMGQTRGSWAVRHHLPKSSLAGHFLPTKLEVFSEMLSTGKRTGTSNVRLGQTGPQMPWVAQCPFNIHVHLQPHRATSFGNSVFRHGFVTTRSSRGREGPASKGRSLRKQRTQTSTRAEHVRTYFGQLLQVQLGHAPLVAGGWPGGHSQCLGIQEWGPSNALREKHTGPGGHVTQVPCTELPLTADPVSQGSRMEGGGGGDTCSGNSTRRTLTPRTPSGPLTTPLRVVQQGTGWRKPTARHT